jgi:hypothetical protein
MSNGSGPIIIQKLIEMPSTTKEEQFDLRQILKRYEDNGHKCNRRDAWRVTRIVWRLLR